MKTSALPWDTSKTAVDSSSIFLITAFGALTAAHKAPIVPVLDAIITSASSKSTISFSYSYFS